MSQATTEEIAEYERRASSEIKWAEGHDDPIWRLANLYRCLDETDDVHYVPTEEQRLLLICIYLRGWRRIIIPKARQLGMSLTLCLVCLDSVTFMEGFNAALIDKTAEDAEKKLREKFKFAWERLPANVRASLATDKYTNAEVILKQPSRPDAPPSTFTAAINFRGGTLSMAWISEWGWVQDNDRPRSREINAGVLPAIERAEDGLCVIETTWSGGLDGELGPYVHEAMNIPEEAKGPRSWRVLFFGWQTNKLYSQDHGVVDPISAQYFREVEAKGVRLTHEQKLWYSEKRRLATSAKKHKEEYPTLVEECWENLPQGSVYGKFIEEARTSGRILNYLPARDYPCHTAWDIGHPMNTVAWLFQVTPQEIRIVDVLMEMDMTMEERAAWLRMRPYDFGRHYFPWDADNITGSTIAPINEFRRILGPQCFVVPKCILEWDGISQTRANFPRFKFLCDSTAKDQTTAGGRIKRGLEYLARFRAERETSTGAAKDVTVHDRYSHCAAALRQIGQALGAGLIEGGNHVGSRDERTTSRPRVTLAGAWQ